MIKLLITTFLLIICKPIFSQTGSENLKLETILGFNVVQATKAELESVGMNPTLGEGGIKVLDFGSRLTAGGGGMVAGDPVKIGDILISIDIHSGWGKLIRSIPILNLKEFCKVLMELKNSNSKFLLKASTSNKSPYAKSRQYTIDISGLNPVTLYQYLEQVDKQEKMAEQQKVEEKPKNDVSVKNTKRNSEGEEDTKDIYASTVDFNSPGKFYAIIIGSSNYKDPGIPDLDSLPIKDAMALKKVLNTKYIFDNENIKALYNPTRRDIVIAFADMSKKITPNDNLLIFYAGHGHYEKESDIGYWLPTDAEVSNPSNWLYNDQLVADVKKIKSLHTLLISDACFSGSIFKTRSVNMEEASSFIKQKYQLPSRKAITSGTLKTVPNKSVFIKYLLDRLSNNKEAFFTASQLFQSLEQPVSNNSKSLPQFGVIQNVGDEGGDFIFIKR
jgi:hypothetical protein